jgi:2-oxoisovalerate dehydrogenase E1 component alpha subunit
MKCRISFGTLSFCPDEVQSEGESLLENGKGASAMADVLLPDTDLEPLQLIAPDGRPTPTAGLDPATIADRLPELYTAMVVTRGLDEELVNLQRQGQLAVYPTCRGQEAAQVGCASALRDTDWLFPQYRELGVFVVRGIDPGGYGLAWRGSWYGGMGFVERCVAPICISVGSHALHAVGAAMASTWTGDGGVTAAFFGDGASSEGDVHEAMNLAGVQAAPCLFFVQNNGWAISTPTSEQYHGSTLARRADGYGIAGVRVDGNDVAACHLVVVEAAARARRGEGPTLIEAVTYRMGPHTTADDPGRYRSAAEVAPWERLDPITRCRAHLRHTGRWADELDEQAQARAGALRAALRAAVFEAPDGPPEEVFDHVFVEPTPVLRAQRAELVAELGRES